MRRWIIVVLALELLVIALVLVLPQVDLLDTAFKAGTTPLAARTRLSSPPFPQAAKGTARMTFTPVTAQPSSEQSLMPGSKPLAESLRLLFCALLC